MSDSRETVVHSIDDPWLDDQVYWSLAETNLITEMVDLVNRSHLVTGQAYHLQLIASNEEGTLPGAITLIADGALGPDPQCLQHLADGLCRLIRPSRYFGADPDDEERELWSQGFVTPNISSHERLRSITLLPAFARDLGRTDFGIEAALAELRGWADALPGLPARTAA